MTPVAGEVATLIANQNHDGGWGYRISVPTPGHPEAAHARSQQSWTETTALGVLALQCWQTDTSPTLDRAAKWLISAQRPDGGWAPNPAVKESTWVTSLALLALHDQLPRASVQRAVTWLAGQVKPNLTLLQRFEYWRADIPPNEYTMGGSPFFPGTSAWIAPTSFSILALATAGKADPQFANLVEHGRAYLLSRRCADGGWNHGGSRYLSENAVSYAETTGLALLALNNVPPDALALAERMAANPDSGEGQCWIHMALLKHGREGAFEPRFPARTSRDLALHLLAAGALSPGNRLMRGAA